MGKVSSGNRLATLNQHSNLDGWPKPGELIEITGAHVLEAADRYALNLLFEYAHDSGQLGEVGADWEISLAKLRISASHNSNERVRDSLERLLRVVLKVPIFDAQTGEPRVLLTNLFAYLDASRSEGSAATVRYAIANKLVPILANSRRWGRIKAEIVCAMRSKYAIALYELIRLRAGRESSVESFSLERFRNLMGVPPGKLKRGADLMQYVIKPALIEVNALSEMRVAIKLDRRSPRAPIERVLMTWLQKKREQLRGGRGIA